MGSSCYVYAILPAGAALPAGLSGLEGAPLRLVGRRRLAAAVSALGDAASARPTLEHMRAHEAVVETLAAVAPVLPVRYGTVLADAPSVRRALDEQADGLWAALQHAGQRVEMTLTVLLSESSIPPVPGGALSPLATPAPGDGRAYMRALVARQRVADAAREHRDRLISLLTERLDSQVVEWRWRVSSMPRPLLRAHLLLDPPGLAHLRAAFDALREELRVIQPEARALLSGPWPPYHFASPAQADGPGGVDEAKSAGPLTRLAQFL